MNFFRNKVVEAVLVLGAIVAVTIAGFAAGDLGLVLADLLRSSISKFPGGLTIVAILVCLAVAIWALPVVVTLLGLVATVSAFAEVMPLKWAIIVAALLWWIISNLVAQWSKGWLDAPAETSRSLIRFWRQTTWWGSRCLGFACPVVPAVILLYGIVGRLTE